MIQCSGLGACGMQVSQTSLSELIPYINNSRTHSDQQVSQIAASIKEFGFNNPILKGEPIESGVNNYGVELKQAKLKSNEKNFPSIKEAV